MAMLTEDAPLMTEKGQFKGKVAIIGGGVAGITAARVFKTQGIDFTLFEASDNLSGVWSQGYPGFAIQTPGKLYEFPDKRMPHPKDFKDGSLIKQYCDDYVADHELENSIKLRAEVVSVTRINHTKWKLLIQSGRGHTHSYEIFDFVVLATGIYSPELRFIPKIEGVEHFKGNIFHSEDTAYIGDRTGKKVVIVGFGKSAQDCAFNAYKESGGIPPLILFRKSHWCVPRKIFEKVPMQWLLYSRFGQGTLPLWQQCGPVEGFLHKMFYPCVWLYWRVVECAFTLQQGLYGSCSHLRPTMAIEDDMYCGHGIISHPDFFPMIHEKKIGAVHSTIQRVLPTGQLQLHDDSIIEADELVFATGFKRNFEFLPACLLEKVESDGIYAYRNMIVPGVPNIAFLNSNVTTFSNITTPAIQSAWLAELINGNIALPPNIEEVVETEKKWRRKHLKHAGESRAYLVQFQQIRYWDSLLCDIGAEVKRKISGYGIIGDAISNFFVPVYSADYKTIVTGEWKNHPNKTYPLKYIPSFWKEWSILGLLISIPVGVVSTTSYLTFR